MVHQMWLFFVSVGVRTAVFFTMKTQHMFPALWYSILGAGAYMYYRLSENIHDHQSILFPHTHVGILTTCLLYLIVEMIQFCITQTVRHKTLPIVFAPQQECNARTHVIVACHNAFESLKESLPTVLDAFPARQIWVADNGTEADKDTQSLCEELGVHYRFYPIPNKTFALYKTAQEIYDQHMHSVDSVLLLDDDTKLPPGFFIRTDILEETLVAGYCPAIVIDKPPSSNVWQRCIDLEYRSISYRNFWRAQTSSIHFVHGIASVYNLRRMLMVYSKLCTMPGGLPFGEDSFAGLDFRLAGYKLKQDNFNVVSTYCPTRLFPPICGGERTQGYGASSLWKQRALRWYLSWPRRIFGELALAMVYDTGSWQGNLMYRLDLVWYFFIVVVSACWPFYLLYIGTVSHSWYDMGAIHATLVATSIATATLRYKGFPANLKDGVHPTTLLLVPFFNTILLGLMASSFLMSIFYYIPWRRVTYRVCYENAM